jgi:hypothetical protein
MKKIAIAGILILGAFKAFAALPPLPSGWPTQFELGHADGPGGAAHMKGVAPFKFRYQYLAGGVNTGNGWANWNPNGDFARFYIEDSIAQGITPIFTYYMIFQSAPGGPNEATAIANNLNTVATMTAYFNDLKLFFQKCSAFPTVHPILHLEPDMWAYIQQSATSDNAATVPVRVASTGLADLASFPNNAAGLAQAIVRLRDLYGPNVLLAFHVSTWGTGDDLIHSDPPDATVISLGVRAGNFYNSFGANFDIAFHDLNDRDAAYKQIAWGDSGAWYNASDYRRNRLFVENFVQTANKRVVLWQLPLGNTFMRAENNTLKHYQSNQVEWFLNDPSRAHIQEYLQAGVVALLFGGGDGNVSTNTDSAADGVTNPAAIQPNPLSGNPNPNIIASQLAAPGSTPALINNGTTLSTPEAADDDGGFFDWKASEYYRTGALSLTGAAVNGCDINGDGFLNVTDVQLCVNQVIYPGTCSGGDINHNGTCDVVDVQRVVNSALGQTCLTQ